MSNAVIIARKGITEFNELFAETCNIVIAGKPAYNTTAVRQVVCKFYQRLSSISRIGNNSSVQTGYRQRIILHRSTERNKLLTKGSKVIISCEPSYNTARIRHSICKFHKSLTSSYAILNDIGFQSGDSISILLHGFTERHKLFTKCTHVVFAGKETNDTAAVRNGCSHLSEGFTSRSSFGNNSSVQTCHFICKVLHCPTKRNELFAESVHIILTGEPANYTTGIRKCSSHLRQCFTSSCSICDDFAINTCNFFRELFHRSTERNEFLSKASQRRTASKPRSKTFKNICSSQNENGFSKSFNTIHHRGIDRRRTLYERLNIGHETGQVSSDLRELTGHATCKPTDDTADKLANGCANTLKHISTFIDKPFQTGNLSQCTNCCQYKSKLGNNNTHTEYANHSSGHQCGNSSQSRHNSRQQTNTDDTLKQCLCVNTLKSINNTRKERHEYINSGLNETGQVASDSFQNSNEELEYGINDRWGVFNQSFKYTGNKLKHTVSKGRNAFNEYVDQHKYHRFDSFTNCRSTVGNNLTERHNGFANLSYDGRDKFGNTGNNYGQRCYNSCSTGSTCGSQCGNTNSKSRQSCTCKCQTSTDTKNRYADQCKCTAQTENCGYQRSKHQTCNTNYSERTSHSNQSLSNSFPTHSAENTKYRCKHQQCGCSHQHSGRTGKCACHSIKTDSENCHGAAKSYKTLSNFLPGHSAHFVKSFCHNHQRTGYGNQTCANSDHVFRHEINCYCDRSESTGHSNQSLCDFFPRQRREILHCRSEYLHRSSNSNQRNACRHYMFGISGKIGKECDFCQ